MILCTFLINYRFLLNYLIESFMIHWNISSKYLSTVVTSKALVHVLHINYNLQF